VFEIMPIKQKYQTNVTIRNSDLCLRIDGHRAKSIARRFLERYHSIIIFKEAILKEKIWTVIMDVGRKEEHIVHIKVDAEIGKILDN
jgi:hypothetical protein